MSVDLKPDGLLGFNRPLTQLVKKTLTVSNPHHEPVIFKVKTTAPKQYCVRPNSGRIEAGGEVEVQVLLQPMREDPPPGAKCRDKFLVQSAFIPASSTGSNQLAEIWQSIEREGKEGIFEHKIRCSFLPPQSASEGTHEGTISDSVINGGVEHHEEEEPRYNTVRSSPPPQRNGNGAVTPPQQSLHDTPQQQSHFEPASESTPARSVVAPAVDETKRVVAEYAKEIERLKDQLAAKTAEVKRAALAPGSLTEKAAHVQTAVIGGDAPTDGYSKEMVALLMFATFIFTWLFF